MSHIAHFLLIVFGWSSQHGDTWIHNHHRLKWHLPLQVSVLKPKTAKTLFFLNTLHLHGRDMATPPLKYAIYCAPTLRPYKVVTHCENSYQLKVNITIFFFQTTEYNERPLENHILHQYTSLPWAASNIKVCLEVTGSVRPINEQGAVI